MKLKDLGIDGGDIEETATDKKTNGAVGNGVDKDIVSEVKPAAAGAKRKKKEVANAAKTEVPSKRETRSTRRK